MFEVSSTEYRVRMINFFCMNEQSFVSRRRRKRTTWTFSYPVNLFRCWQWHFFWDFPNRIFCKVVVDLHWHFQCSTHTVLTSWHTFSNSVFIWVSGIIEVRQRYWKVLEGVMIQWFEFHNNLYNSNWYWIFMSMSYIWK